MDWFEPIAAYCERTDAGFWAEPVNAATNAAFLVAAGVALRAERRHGPDPACRGLAALTAIVGLGSFLFHTLAVRWSMLADVVPIALFIHAYFWLAMVRFLGLGPWSAAAATLAFAAAGFGLVPVLDAVAGGSIDAATNGSVAYLPAILALAGVAAAAPGDTAAQRATRRRLVAIAGLFVVSLACRTLDRDLCSRFALGTHFLWHVLNAGVLYGLIAAALRARRPAAA